MPTDMIHSFRVDTADLPSEAVLFGSTSAMREVRGQIERILHNDLPVLIQGESGTGKEMVARYLHARSDRFDLPFVKVSCVAPTSEGEDSGSGGGSLFDDAHHAEPAESWLADAAAGGTLFFDEVGDLSWDLQFRLLDLLENRQPVATGANSRARVICSTNRDLEAAVERRLFRRDLFYRIDVISLRLTPLRERKEDIPQLCDHFIERLARKFDKTAPQLSAGEIERLKDWAWPGNLRELESRIERLIVLGDSGVFEANAIKRAERGRTQGDDEALRKAKKKLPRKGVLPARAALLRVLRANRWNRRQAAEDMQMSYRSFLARMRKVGVPRRTSRLPAAPPEAGRRPGLGCE